MEVTMQTTQDERQMVMQYVNDHAAWPPNTDEGIRKLLPVARKHREEREHYRKHWLEESIMKPLWLLGGMLFCLVLMNGEPNEPGIWALMAKLITGSVLGMWIPYITALFYFVGLVLCIGSPVALIGWAYARRQWLTIIMVVIVSLTVMKMSKPITGTMRAGIHWTARALNVTLPKRMTLWN